MAGELASQLEDDQPCPVCGAADHPLRPPSADLVTADDVAAAESRVARCRAAELGGRERTAAALEATLVQLREQLGDETARPVRPWPRRSPRPVSSSTS